MAVSTRLLGSNGQYSRYPLAFFLDEMRRLGLRSLDFVPQVPHFFCGYRDHDEDVYKRQNETSISGTEINRPALNMGQKESTSN